MIGVPTTKFYEPLTTALDKSIVHNPTLELTKSRAYEQMGATSRISRRMRSLSPQQATYIKNSTFLPVDKDLVPTDHLWRVRGKQFSAVNIQVKQGAPIPASMIRIPPNPRGGVITTQTVYEARPKSSMRTLNNTRSITNLRTVYPRPPPTVTQVPVMSRVVQPAEMRRPASPIRVSTSAVMQSPTQKSIQPLATVNRTNISNHLYNQQVSNKTSNMPVQTMPKPSAPVNEYYASELRSDYDEASKKGKYKYNFFSALDEAINTKCGSCGSNQIIASKPLSSWQ